MIATVVGLELDRTAGLVATLRLKDGLLMFDTFKVPVSKITTRGAHVRAFHLGEDVEFVVEPPPATEPGKW